MATDVSRSFRRDLWGGRGELGLGRKDDNRLYVARTTFVWGPTEETGVCHTSREAVMQCVHASAIGHCKRPVTLVLASGEDYELSAV